MSSSSSQSLQSDCSASSSSKIHSLLGDVVIFPASIEHMTEDCSICYLPLPTPEDESTKESTITSSTSTAVMLAKHTTRNHGIFHLICLDTWTRSCISQNTPVTCPMDRDILRPAPTSALSYGYATNPLRAAPTPPHDRSTSGTLIQFPLHTLHTNGERGRHQREFSTRDTIRRHRNGGEHAHPSMDYETDDETDEDTDGIIGRYRWRNN